MKTKTAETYLPCIRKGKPLDATVQKALRVAERDDALRALLTEQAKFDDQIVAAIHSIHPPKNLREKLAALGAPVEKAETGLRSQLFHPAMLSAVAGILLLLGILIYSGMNRMAAFPGKEAVETMVATADEMTGVEFEPTSAEAGTLGDSFYMRGFEGYVLPAELSRLPTVGFRVFKQRGRPVAQLAVDANNALLFIFQGAHFGVDPGRGEWRVFTQGAWAVAVRDYQGICAVIAFRGGKPEMKRFLETLKP